MSGTIRQVTLRITARRSTGGGRDSTNIGGPSGRGREAGGEAASTGRRAGSRRVPNHEVPGALSRGSGVPPPRALFRRTKTLRVFGNKARGGAYSRNPGWR